MEKTTPIFIVCMGNPWGWNETILKIFFDRTDAEKWLADQNYSFIFAPYVYIKDEKVTSLVPDEYVPEPPITAPDPDPDPEPTPPDLSDKLVETVTANNSVSHLQDLLDTIDDIIPDNIWTRDPS
jgi:hypothetical protein